MRSFQLLPPGRKLLIFQPQNQLSQFPAAAAEPEKSPPITPPPPLPGHHQLLQPAGAELHFLSMNFRDMELHHLKGLKALYSCWVPPGWPPAGSPSGSLLFLLGPGHHHSWRPAPPQLSPAHLSFPPPHPFPAICSQPEVLPRSQHISAWNGNPMSLQPGPFLATPLASL